MIFRVIEIGILMLLAWGVISQIMIPSINGLPFFPILNKKRRTLIEENKQLLDTKDVQKLDRDMDELRQEVKQTQPNQKESPSE